MLKAWPGISVVSFESWMSLCVDVSEQCRLSDIECDKARRPCKLSRGVDVSTVLTPHAGFPPMQCGTPGAAHTPPQADRDEYRHVQTPLRPSCIPIEGCTAGTPPKIAEEHQDALDHRVTQRTAHLGVDLCRSLPQLAVLMPPPCILVPGLLLEQGQAQLHPSPLDQSWDEVSSCAGACLTTLESGSNSLIQAVTEPRPRSRQGQLCCTSAHQEDEALADARQYAVPGRLVPMYGYLLP